MSSKTFIWDLDGTLLDSYTAILAAITQTFKELGIIIDEKETHKYVITYSVTAFLQMIADKNGISFDDIKARYSQISDKQQENIQPIAYSNEVLKNLKAQGAKHFVYTHRGKTTAKILEKLNFQNYFEEIITSQNNFARKPNPDAILYLIKKYNLDMQNTYYVGDRTIDMDCAKNAGVKGILYLPSNSFCSPNGAENYIVHNLMDILTIAL